MRSSPWMQRLFSHHHQGVDGDVAESLAAVQEAELDHERAGDGLAADAAHELERSLHRSARRQEVVDEQHALPRHARVEMDLDLIRAVLELIALRSRLPGQLSRLPDRDEALAEVRSEEHTSELQSHSDL